MRIDLTHITKIFGPLRANDDITLSFTGGQLIAILGENGAGKSTLMKILSGYQSADAGQIKIDGQPIVLHTPADALTHGIGMLHQDPLDVSTLTVLENFMLGRPGAVFVNQREGRRNLIESTTRLGFDLDPNRYIDNLTVGERQQLEIVRLLSLGARVLILDEPTTGISEAQKNTLFQALRRLARTEGLIVILVSHKLADVEQLCDQAVVLRSGKVVGQTPLPCPSEQLITLMFGQLPTLMPVPAIPERTPEITPVLRVQALQITDARFKVESITLTVYPGEVIGLAGLEGSGQRPFLRACAGLEKPSHGRIFLADQDLTTASYYQHLRSGIAYAPSGRLEEGLITGLTLAEHFALVEPSGFWIDRAAIANRTKRAVEQYRIKGAPDSLIDTLSGGNQQRVLLALLPSNLKVLLLENPTRGLDLESAHWIWSQLLERRAQGTTILFISPELDEIVSYSSRIGVFFGGYMTLIDDPAQVTLTQLGELIGGKA